MSKPRSTSLVPLLLSRADRHEGRQKYKDFYDNLSNSKSHLGIVRAMLDEEDSETEGYNGDLEDERQPSRRVFKGDVEYEADAESDSESELESGQGESNSAPESKSVSSVQRPTPNSRPHALSSPGTLPSLHVQRRHYKSSPIRTDIQSYRSQTQPPKGHHVQRDSSPEVAQIEQEDNLDEASRNQQEGQGILSGDDEQEIRQSNGGQSDENTGHESEAGVKAEHRGSKSVLTAGPEPQTAHDIENIEADPDAYSLPSLGDDNDDVDSTESDFHLAKLRQESLNRLSHAWADIFERYGKDVSELPPDDEIDLITGEIVVDNGALRSRSKTVFGSLTKLGHALKRPLAEERDRLQRIHGDKYYEESETGSEYHDYEEAQVDSSEHDFDERSEQQSGNNSEHQSIRSSPAPSNASFAEEERDELENIWGSTKEGSEPDSRSETNAEEGHSHDVRFHQFRDPQSILEDRLSSSECGSNNNYKSGYEDEQEYEIEQEYEDEPEHEDDPVHENEPQYEDEPRYNDTLEHENEPGYDDDDPEFTSTQASLSRSSASFEAASRVYITEWRRARMIPRARALADALIFNQPLTTTVAPSSPSKRSFNSIFPSSSPPPPYSLSRFDSPAIPQSYSVKRRRPNDVEYDLSLMPELDEDYV